MCARNWEAVGLDVDGTDIGAFVARERQRRGWTQAHLARLLPVGQQTVSRWEQGRSRPERPMIGGLSEILGIPVSVLLEAAGYDSPVAGQARAVAAPVRPLVEALPLHELPPDRFEQFCRDFIVSLRKVSEVYRAGSQGHTQHGIDLMARLPDGTVEVFQVKRHREFGPAKVRAAVEATDMEADRYFLLLARRTASQQARQEAGIHGWALWDAEDISRLVRLDLDRDAAIRLVDTYFPHWREDFLGEPTPGPWRTTEEFFLRHGTVGIYNHDHRLVGRDQLVDEIAAWARDSEQPPVSVLVGRGGLGKTRLARAVATRVESQDGMQVRVLDVHATVSPREVDLLPSSGRVLVIVDDVHDRDDVSLLVTSLLRSRPNTRLLLSLRPYGEPSLIAALRQAGLRLQDLPQWELEDLTVEEAEQLAAFILQQDHAPLARQLGALTRDCPLITVVAAELLDRGELQPWEIRGANDLRQEVLTAFRDALVRSGGADHDRFRLEVLNAVAVLQPLRTDDETFRSVMGEVIGMSWDRIDRELHSLEDAGVLLRRGRSLRIVPDLLGDAVLADACFDRAGASTGFVERVFAEASGEPRQHVFINANRVDWRVRQRAEVDEALTTMLWKAVSDEFRAAGIWGRSDLMKLIARVAAFAPARAVELVRWAIENPTDEAEVDHPLSGWLPDPTYDGVLEEMPPVLRGVAYSLDHLPEALDLLWRLALDDSRPTNQHPEHAIRVLTDLAEYEIGKPLVYNEVVADKAAAWLRDGPRSQYHSPFDVLEPLLATEGTDETATARAISFKPFALDPTKVQRLRSCVVDFALEELRSPDPRRAVRAVRAIQASLRGPSGLFGRTVSDDERTKWTPVFLETIEALRQAAVSADLDPVVWIAIKEAVSWHATWSSSKTKAAAQQLLAQAPSSLVQELTEALIGRNPWMEDAEDDYTKAERKRKLRLAAVATQLTTGHDPDQIVELLEERLATLERAFEPMTGEPGALTAKLVETQPAVPDALYRRISAHPSSSCLRVLPAALSVQAEVQGDQAIRQAAKLLRLETAKIDASVAHALGWGRGRRSGLLTGELALLQSMAVHEDALVRRAVVRAAHVLASDHPQEALDLLLSVPFADSSQVAEELLGSFGRRGEFSWDQLDDAQFDSLLEQLQRCPTLDGYEIHSALTELSALVPDKVLALLKTRINAKQHGSGGENYQALPFKWQHPFKFREHDRFPTLLEHVRDWIAEDTDSYWRHTLGAQLFRAVAGVFDDEVLRVLREGVTSGDEAQIRSVGSILGEAPRHLVWDKEFVSTVLEGAQQHCPDCLRHVAGELHSAGVSGLRTGTPGEPFPDDVHQREEADKRIRQLPVGSAGRRFYEALRDSAIRSIEWAKEEDPGLIDGRDW